MHKFLTIALVVAVLSVVNAASLIAPRIIGGHEVDIAKHPYLVSIRFRQTKNTAYLHYCAGSIYSERVIITGAQCVARAALDDRVMVVAGAKARKGADGLPYPVKKSISHPRFSFNTADYDIAIMILEIPITFGHFDLRPIEIFPNRPAIGRLGTIPGWGYIDEDGPSSNNLEETQVPIVSTADCEHVYGKGEVTQRMICAGYIIEGGKDGCQGDTSGPLIFDGKLVGLLSWGRGCGRPGFPSVYTYVPELKQWIDDTIAANIDK